MPARLAPELRRLYRILRQHPAGLSEYALLQHLRGAGPLQGLEEVELFRIHFLLFHHLHRLRQELERQRLGTVEIHCLNIRLQPIYGHHPNPDQLPLAPDPVAAYYLDAEHLATTGEQVYALLQWFWKRYRVHDRREAALAELELGPAATAGEVSRRFHRLARRHHPDQGGDPERFRRLVEAVEVLRVAVALPPGSAGRAPCATPRAL